MSLEDVWSIAGAIIASLGGGALIVLGLSSWLGKLWASRILQNERQQHATDFERFKSELEQLRRRFQGEIDKTVFVHRVQFETEFSAMRDIWARVMNVRGTMAALRPTASTAPENETEEEALQRVFIRRRTFGEALNELKDAVFNNGPFISKPIYQELFNRLLMAASAEILSVQVHRPTEPNWYDTGERNLGDFMSSADRVSRMIRERIAHLALLPGQ